VINKLFYLLQQNDIFAIRQSLAIKNTTFGVKLTLVNYDVATLKNGWEMGVGALFIWWHWLPGTMSRGLRTDVRLDLEGIVVMVRAGCWITETLHKIS
jgi:hypothetical protein